MRVLETVSRDLLESEQLGGIFLLYRAIVKAIVEAWRYTQPKIVPLFINFLHFYHGSCMANV